jgi:hypothetical protein
MADIRPFNAEHLPEVARLYMKVMRGRSGNGGDALQRQFRRIFLENPWVAEDIPSLCSFEGDTLAGFLGVVPRPMLFKGSPIRMAVTSQFMVDRETSRGPVAMELLGRFFSGPQDLSFGDGASEEAQRVYVGLGGHGSGLYSFNWLRPLRPVQTLEYFLNRGGGALRAAGRIAGAIGRPAGYLLSRLPVAVFRKPESPYSSRRVEAAELLQCITEIGWREPLRPAYEPASFEWLMSAAAGPRPGELHLGTVRDQGGTLAGWYIFQGRAGCPADLLQLGVRRPNQADAVIAALFRDAWEKGASSVRGQAIPALLVNLTNQYCLFRQANTCVVFHSRDTKILDAIYRGKAALTRLDGECWMGFSTEDWSS